MNNSIANFNNTQSNFNALSMAQAIKTQKINISDILSPITGTKNRSSSKQPRAELIE